MKIVIVGAGEVGRYLCQLLSKQAHEVTLIELSEATVQKVDEEFNAKVLHGNGSSTETLVEARLHECDFFLAMTSDDKTNLIASSLANALGAKATIARIHDQTYTDNSYLNYQLHFGIDLLINPEALCAVELAKTIRHPGRVAVENFARGQIEVQQAQVTHHSKLIGKNLKELGLDPKTRIGYVQRGNEIEVPSADTILQEGDLVTLFGTPQALFKVKLKLDPDSVAQSVRVVLFGGSETAIALVRLLTNPRFKIRIIEKDPTLCQHLAEKFSRVTVIHGDATSLRLLEEEHIGSTDYFVACTKKDEDNIMTGLQASKLGAAHVQLVINKTDYEEVLDRFKGALGVELTVSPRIATANEVLRYLASEPLIELATLPNGVGKILEIRVGQTSEYAGKSLKEIALPRECVVVALLHKFQAKVPGADDTILAGDRIVIVTKEGNVPQLRSLLED